ncbi:DUF503 domain-containing protein [Savagea sp. SN6]|uniref:DUF503 domain-containing protein n=1 Tax=Savagea serpentis TaxID=2785297 RepID=A0A8J7KKH6_9BACL|nr:DUF503 domain-containing protein [Savagea serpentis]MBF4499984.1 DUF503 domain-containing protein [Savagea serpentis]
MIVSYECTFFIPAVHSLKAKRSIVQRMVQRARQRYNVSVSEVDFQDVWQRATIAVVAVSETKAVAEREVERVLALFESEVEWELTELVKDYF